MLPNDFEQTTIHTLRKRSRAPTAQPSISDLSHDLSLLDELPSNSVCNLDSTPVFSSPLVSSSSSDTLSSSTSDSAEKSNKKVLTSFKRIMKLFGSFTRKKILHRRFRVWIAILLFTNYRYWMGRPHFPLTCNLVSLNCKDWVQTISGYVAPGYEPVRKAFEQNFLEGLEVGASFSAYVDGIPVVELYGGYHDRRYQRPYDSKTLQLVFSSSKVVESILVTSLIDKGLLSFDDKITKYWPEFAQGNKENVTVGCLLGHRAGVTYLNKQPTLKQLQDLDLLAEMLAKQPHNFGGEAVQGYHAVTRGWYLNELVRRVDPQHRTIGQMIREDIMPLLGIEFYVGLPSHLESRVSPLIGFPLLRSVAKLVVPDRFQNDPVTGVTKQLIFNRKSVAFKALRGSGPRQLRMWPHTHNRKEIWRSEGSSFNGITNAKSSALLQLARLAALMANEGSIDAVELISPETVQKSLTPLTSSVDAVVTRNITFARGGFGIDVEFPGVKGKWAGWGGAGGSMVWWNWNPHTKQDAEGTGHSGDWRKETNAKKVAFSYVQNSVGFTSLGDKRSWRILRALMDTVDGLDKER
ncbi:hypothetical protein HK098_001813 [Nowakowskiella sp. JEL0407]|nr:hypothetical protein HK098_001813 [Nowakowskiella sp. JEL0407]